VNGTATTYSVDDRNELTAGPDPAYGYDGNGNMTSKGMGSGTTYYTYDDENRLIVATYSTSYHTTFAYDGLGRLRVRTEYTWNGSGWAVSSESSPSDPSIRELRLGLCRG
jgi:YD repeat-containing protein